MSLRRNLWSPEDVTLIQEVEKRADILLRPDKTMSRYKYGAITRKIWKEIRSEVGYTSKECQRKWYQIKSRYAVLKNMLSSGQVTEEIVERDPLVYKYLDKSLDFLEPYIDEITNTKMRGLTEFIKLVQRLKWVSVEASQNAIKNLIDKRKDEEDLLEPGDMEYLMKMIEIAVEDSLKDFKIGSDTNLHRNREKVTFVEHEDGTVSRHFSNKQLVTRKHILDEIIENTLTDFEPEQQSTVSSNKRIKTENQVDNTSINESMDTDLLCDPVDVFLIKYNVNNEQTNIKDYMKELSEVLCQRLAYEKRKDFLSRIDTLVSKILEQ